MRCVRWIVAVAASAALSSAATAGIYTDDLSRCLVAKATDADRIVLMQWMFGAMASHPAVVGMSNLTLAQHQSLNLNGAHLFERLMLVDCHAEVVAALKNEGAGTIEISFQVLGQVAARGLFSDPAVAAQTEAMSKMVDPAKFAALAKEAGLPGPTVTPTPAAK